MPQRTITIRLDAELLEKIESQADERDCSRNKAISDLLTSALDPPEISEVNIPAVTPETLAGLKDELISAVSEVRRELLERLEQADAVVQRVATENEEIAADLKRLERVQSQAQSKTQSSAIKVQPKAQSQTKSIEPGGNYNQAEMMKLAGTNRSTAKRRAADAAMDVCEWLELRYPDWERLDPSDNRSRWRLKQN